MTRPPAFAIAALLAMCFALPGWAGGITGCRTPFAYDSAVNVFVLEDASDAHDDTLRDVRRRLAWLVKLDALFSDGYGSLGVLFLSQTDAPCTLDDAMRDFGQELPQRGAAVFVHQRVYSEDEKIFVQSYLEFFRLDADGKRSPELVRVDVPERKISLSEELPMQRLSFPPRVLEASDVDEIEKDFDEAARLYTAPEAGSASRSIDLSAKEGPVGFQVLASRPDGWMEVDSRLSPEPFTGWLRADPQVKRKLRTLLPELNFIDGLVGYLSFLQARDHAFRGLNGSKSIAARADLMLHDYAYSGPLRREVPRRNGDRRSDAGADASVLAAAMRTDIALKNVDQLDLATEALFSNVASSRDSRLRDLLGVARVADCCIFIAGGSDARAMRLADLSATIPDFQAALAIDPTNAHALANLGSAYRLFKADAPKGPPKSEDLRRDFIRKYYERQLPAIVRIADQLDQHLANVEELQQAPLK